LLVLREVGDDLAIQPHGWTQRLGQVGVEVGSPLLFVKRRQSVHGVRSRLWVSLGPTVFRHELLQPADRLVATYLHFLLYQGDLGLEPGDDATSTLLVMVFDD